MTTGNITFPRPDAAELLAIRHGEYSYDALMAKVGDVDTYFDALKDKYVLPHSPDRVAVDKLCQTLIRNRQKD